MADSTYNKSIKKESDVRRESNIDIYWSIGKIIIFGLAIIFLTNLCKLVYQMYVIANPSNIDSVVMAFVPLAVLIILGFFLLIVVDTD